MKKIEPIPPSLPLLTKGEFYLEDEEIFSGLLINGVTKAISMPKIWY